MHSLQPHRLLIIMMSSILLSRSIFGQARLAKMISNRPCPHNQKRNYQFLIIMLFDKHSSVICMLMLSRQAIFYWLVYFRGSTSCDTGLWWGHSHFFMVFVYILVRANFHVLCCLLKFCYTLQSFLCLRLHYLEAYLCLYPQKSLLLIMHALRRPDTYQYQR